MADPPLRLLLVRHGQVDANIEYRFLGRRDDPLNATGEEQARMLAALFADIQVDRVISSPLARARRTAEGIAAAAGTTVLLDERLVELDFGRWEGLTREQAAALDPGELEALARWDADPGRPAPGGESLLAVQRRVVAFADAIQLEAPGATVAAVTHMGPIKTLLCAALGVELAVARRLFLDPATVSVLDWSARPMVRLFNSHAHLGWTNARWLRPRRP
jgi:broad specificity phosphatase PhoE